MQVGHESQEDCRCSYKPEHLTEQILDLLLTPVLFCSKEDMMKYYY
jgi:hypothetical protein